jgi:Mrp family chromosome partitioning ATPase
VVVVVFVSTTAYTYSASRSPKYAASADVLLSSQNLAASLNDIQDPGANASDSNRVAQTQANLATAPTVLRLTLQAVGLPQTDIQGLLARSTVRAKPNADILTFEVEDSNATRARELASAYARSYTTYRRTLDSFGVERALARVRQRLQELRTQAEPNRALIASLGENEDRLNTLGAFQASNAFLVRSPDSADQISPKPRRALLIGLFFGGLLGLGLALLRDRFDTRVQDPDEVASALGLPLLSRVPELPRRSREAHTLAMLAEPHGISAEAFRILRANVDFATIDGDVKTIMVTSSVEAEGKSTTAANLALAYARAGRRVILVDLDLRRPYVAKFFDLVGAPGVTDIALGEASLEEALTEIDRESGAPSAEPSEVTHGNGEYEVGRYGAASTDRWVRTRVVDQGSKGNLRVLPSGPMPPDTGEFVGSTWLGQLLQELRRDADIVLVDAPPLLSVSDALALSAHVDAMLFVARLLVVRRSMFKGVRALLSSSPVHVLGCVVAGVQGDPVYAYSYSYGYKTTNTPIEAPSDAAVSVRPARPAKTKP